MKIQAILRVTHLVTATMLALPGLVQAKPLQTIKSSSFQVYKSAKGYHLHPIIGKPLRQLIVGSIVAELDKNGRAGPGELYSRDGIYQFLGSDVMAAVRMPYRVTKNQVCLISGANQSCFAYFKEYKGRYRRLRYDGTESAVIIDQGK